VEEMLHEASTLLNGVTLLRRDRTRQPRQESRTGLAAQPSFSPSYAPRAFGLSGVAVVAARMPSQPKGIGADYIAPRDAVDQEAFAVITRPSSGSSSSA